MYSFAKRADETENYLTEKNIFQFTRGTIYRHTPPLEPEGALIFRENVYIQYATERFALWDNGEIPFTRDDVATFATDVLKEEDGTYISVRCER